MAWRRRRNKKTKNGRRKKKLVKEKRGNGEEKDKSEREAEAQKEGEWMKIIKKWLRLVTRNDRRYYAGCCHKDNDSNVRRSNAQRTVSSSEQQEGNSTACDSALCRSTKYELIKRVKFKN